MAQHIKTGKTGEAFAIEYLKQNKYAIREQNYRYKKAEVDIIAQQENVLVFVEVKTRHSNTFGYPEEFVSEQKRNLFLLAADEYIYIINWQHDIRFDIIAITGTGPAAKIHHIQDAFH